MTLIAAIFLAQAATSAPVPITIPNLTDISPPPGTVLWREFREGMAPEIFAVVARKLDGVKAVEVTPKRKVKMSYASAGGILIGSVAFTVVPDFQDLKLYRIGLTRTDCLTTIKALAETMAEPLREKYPKTQKVRVVDDNGVTTDNQYAFYNDESRVTVSSVTIYNPYPEHVYGGGGKFMRAANALANSLADDTYNSAIEACPNDGGKKATLTLTYASQATFEEMMAVEKAERDKKAKSLKDGL